MTSLLFAAALVLAAVAAASWIDRDRERPRGVTGEALRDAATPELLAIELVVRLAWLAIEPLVEVADREGGQLVRGADGVVSVELGSDAGVVRVRGAESVSA